MRVFDIDEALKTMSALISSINHINIDIEDERDFKILERFSEKAKIINIYFTCRIQEIYEPR